MTDGRKRVGGTSAPGVKGLGVLHHFSERRIVVVECNGSRCHEQSAQTATPPLTLVTAIKILENNKEGHAGRGQRGLHRPSPPEGSTDANERGGPRNGRRNVSIKNHRRTFFVAAANAAIKSRQRRSTDAALSSPSLKFAASLASASHHRGRERSSKDGGVACHKIMYGGLHR